MNTTFEITARLATLAPFPYSWPGEICYVIVTDVGIRQASRTRDEFRNEVRDALAGKIRLLAAWPGQWRTDLFEIDDVPALAVALGIKA